MTFKYPIDQPSTQKISKEKAGYSVGHLMAHCEICKYYNSNVCQRVQGFIRPSYWCKLFERRGAK